MKPAISGVKRWSRSRNWLPDISSSRAICPEDSRQDRPSYLLNHNYIHIRGFTRALVYRDSCGLAFVDLAEGWLNRSVDVAPPGQMIVAGGEVLEVERTVARGGLE